jgi:flagellar hook-length control protein FliK
MSFNEFVLPALPQTPAAGLSRSDSLHAAAPQCPCNRERADGKQSFLATLNQVSENKNHGKPQKPTAEKTQGAAERSDTGDSESVPTPTAADPLENGHNGSPAAAAIPPTDASALIDLWQALGIGRPLSAGFGKMDEQLALFDAQAGSLTADVSPQTTPLFYFKHLMAQAGFNSAAEGQQEMQAQFFRFRQWMAQLHEGLTGVQPQPLLSASKNTISDLFPMQWALGANAEIAGRVEQISAAPAEVIHMLKHLFFKMESNSSINPSADSENPAMATGGKNQMDPELAEESKNLQRFKLAAGLKTAAQPAIQNPSAEGPVARPVEEVLSLRGAAIKPQVPVADEFGGKVFHIEADNKDSGLLYAHDPMSERMGKLEDAARTTESAPRSFSSEMLNQIVQKAVLSLKNGQNQVQIDLKPDFLGHIRMQIITENQQVAVKIFAEFPFVKDMLESNLHHLKAELQAQGLEIDELQVCVSDDADREADPNSNAAELRRLKATGSSNPTEAETSDEPWGPNSDGGEPISETAIDYFA